MSNDDLKKVLVINDDATQRQRIRQIIEGLCDVDTPESYKLMIARLEKILENREAYALVIIDHLFDYWDLEPPQEGCTKAPPKNGREIVVNWLRPSRGTNQEEARPPIIFITNYSDKAMTTELEQKYRVVVDTFGELEPNSLYHAVEELLDHA